MEQSRLKNRGSVPNIDFDNARRESEPSARHAKTRSRSPLCSYKDSSSNITSSAEFSKTDAFAASLSRSQTLSSSQQRNRPTQPISHTESEVRTYSKTGDYLRRHEGFRRTGSMQMSNFNDAPPRDATYNFGPPQNLHTICNGNNMTNSLPQSQEKNASSGTNTFTSGAASGTTASMSSHCKNCKRLEEQERILAYSLNQVLNHVNDIIDKENAWRQGAIAFSIGNFNWINDEDRTIDPQILKRTDSGRLLVEVKKQVIEMRKKFEDLILDVENLSKTNLFQDVQLKPKENRLMTEDLSPTRINPGKKLLASIADAKQYIESLKSAMFTEEIPTEIREEIRSKPRQEPLNKNIATTLMLQLDQSKRERRALEIELTLQKKKVLQNQNMLNTSYLKEIIRQIVDEEIKSSQNNNSS